MSRQDEGIRRALMRCLKNSFDEVNTRRPNEIPTDSLADINLYGENGVFDSLQLVDFMVIFEEQIAERLGFNVSIVSAKAVSRKVNPFRNVSTLVDYVIEELEPAATAQASR